MLRLDSSRPHIRDKTTSPNTRSITMSLPESTKSYIVNVKPEKEITSETFKLVTTPLDKVTGSQLLLRVQYLSNDPAQRTWIQKGAEPERAYAPIPAEGDVMPARGICTVLAAGPEAKKFKKGDSVIASTGWTQYLVVEEKTCQTAAQIPGQSPSVALGALGLTGLTAYWGLLEIAKTTSDDQCVVISGAAGATGSMAVQLAKHVLNIKKVVGVAGGKEKCDFVKSIGADYCIDYKSSTWKQDLRKITERKIGMFEDCKYASSTNMLDVYFDNVGGEILDETLSNMKR